MSTQDVIKTLEDEAFLAAFRSVELPLAEFSHEAHVRLGWLHLSREPKDEAIANVVREIRNYVAIHGKEDKYHHTLTIAAMHVLHQAMGSSEVRTFKEFLKDRPELLNDLKGLLNRHYSEARLFSPEAAAIWVEPDLVPF